MHFFQINRFVPRGILKKKKFKGIIKTFWVKILQNCVFKMINLFIYANLLLLFYFKNVIFGRTLHKG